MRRLVAAVALVAFGALAGCAAPRTAGAPIGRAVDVVLVDGRPDAYEERGPGYSEGFLYALPILPLYAEEERFFLDQSLLPAIVDAVAETGLFGAVVGPGDDVTARRGAPYELRVTLQETRYARRRTTYGLGFAGIVLHALGAPLDYTSVAVALGVECIRREDGATAARGEGAETELGFLFIYEDENPEKRQFLLRRGVRWALDEALSPLLD